MGEETSRMQHRHTFSSTLEEEAHNEDLKPSHRYHHQTFYDAEVEDTSFGTAHSAEIPVLASAEVFLVPGDGGQLARNLHNGLLQRRCLLGARSLFGRKLGPLFILDLHKKSISLNPSNSSHAIV